MTIGMVAASDNPERAVHVAKEFGEHLIGREIGGAIRSARFSGQPSGWIRVLDFSGVAQATESCIDELFAPLARTHGLGAVRSIEIRNANQPVRETIDYVMSILEAPPRAMTRDSLQLILDKSRKGPKSAKAQLRVARRKK